VMNLSSYASYFAETQRSLRKKTKSLSTVLSCWELGGAPLRIPERSQGHTQGRWKWHERFPCLD
jgi:hypothetical protein